MILGYINQQLVELGIWFWVFSFSSICWYHLHLMLFYKIKKEKEKSSINLIKPNTPLMNKTLNETQDLIENAQTGRSIAKDCWGQIFSHHMISFYLRPAPSQHYHGFLGESLLKPKKSPYLHKKASKPMVQTHNTSSYFLTHDPSSWVSLREFWKLWFGGQEVCSIKLQWFKIDKGQHVACHVFPNSLNFDGLVYNK